jgi:hypothetical protein
MSPGTWAWPGREWRRQFFDSTQEELYFEIDVCGHGELGMVHRRLQVHETPGPPWPTNAIPQNWRGYTCFFRKRRATFENPLTQGQWENL